MWLDYSGTERNQPADRRAGAPAHPSIDLGSLATTHRGHGHMLAKGGKPKQMMAELFGKKTGYCKGKGGSMHIVSYDLGILGANGIVGGGIPIATGAALASTSTRLPHQRYALSHPPVCTFA